MGAYSFTIFLSGFQIGPVRETLSQKLPVTISVCSNDAVKHLPSC